MSAYVQRDQPPGVPPLELTGERTLPDVPAENYWYRRHLAVYEWIGARVIGRRVIDMACGEGYGSEVLSRSAASVLGVDANPEAHEHARLRYTRQNLQVRARAWSRTTARPAPTTPSCFCRRSSTSRIRRPCCEHFRSLLAPGGRRIHLDAQRADARAARGREVRQPVAHQGVPRHGVRARCAAACSATSRCSACSTPASCASTSWRWPAAGTPSTPGCGSPSRSTTASRRRSPPRDFALRRHGPGPRAGLPGRVR